MNSDAFYTNLIQQHINLAKSSRYEAFKSVLENIYSEAEDLPPQQPAPTQTNQSPNIDGDADGSTKPENSVLASDDPIVTIKLSKLLVAALFTDIDKIAEKDSNVFRLKGEISEIKQNGISGEDSAKRCLNVLQEIIKHSDFPIDDVFNKEFNNFSNFASKNILINLIVDALFVSKDLLLKADSTLGPKMDTISSLLGKIQQDEKADLNAASQTAALIQKNVRDILPTISLTI
jgi:hypothetical protein